MLPQAIVAQGIVATAQRYGSDAKTVRDATHEACHALEANAERWNRDTIHEALVHANSGERWRLLAAEVRARAVERRVCETLGVQYDAAKWLDIAALETMKTGIQGVPADFWSVAVTRAMTNEHVQDMVERILKLWDQPV